MKIVTVVGARPQFIKAAVVSRAIDDYNQMASPPSAAIREILVHTGQHFDDNMSKIFFEELDIPLPHYNLGIGGTSHGAMTGRMLERIEQVLLDEKPDWVLVYGDTNSTLAGALAAAKLHIPVAHVEAGLRSFNRRMPEEINRILTDHVASLLFCPTDQAVGNLRREGFKHVRGGNNSGVNPGSPLVCKVGDVMYDAALFYAPKAERVSTIIERLEVQPRGYVLATVHREENTDNPERLRNIFAGLAQVARELPVILPLHPRTRQALDQTDAAIKNSRNLILLPPLGYLDMICLEKNANVIITDSGGVQKEAFFYRIPCITLRQETEWVELVELGCNRLAGSDPQSISFQVADLVRHENSSDFDVPIYGEGDAGKLILEILLAHKLP